MYLEFSEEISVSDSLRVQMPSRGWTEWPPGLHSVPLMGIKVVRHLEESDGVLFYLPVHCVRVGNALHRFRFGVAVVILDGFVDAQNDQMILPE